MWGVAEFTWVYLLVRAPPSVLQNRAAQAACQPGCITFCGCLSQLRRLHIQHESCCALPPKSASQVNRGGMGASGHLDADSINLEELEAANKQEEAALESMKAPPGTQE